MLSIFCAPSRYVQGRDATSKLGDEMKKLGLTGRAVIIAGSSAAELLHEIWLAALSDAGIALNIVEFRGECSQEEINRCKKIAKDERATVIIGAGGGKVLDTARAVAAELDLPVVNCPTTASSDAPCSALSVVYKEDGSFEKYLFYKKNPELVLVDTTVIAAAPPRLLSAGMGDALATMFEAQTVANAAKKNQVGGRTSLAAGAISQLCYQVLLEDGAAALRAVRNRVVTPAVERIIEANTLLSGLGFESGGLAVAHSVHNGLTTAEETHNFFHGEKVAFGLLVQLILEGRPAGQIDEVMQFCTEVELPITLTEIGLEALRPDVLENIARRTVAPGETAHNEPFPVNAEMIADAIIAADVTGTEFQARFGLSPGMYSRSSSVN